MAAPTIVIVPGLWLGPRPYELLAKEIKKILRVAEIVYAPLRSTGQQSPGAPNMYDDAVGIREVIRPLVEAGKSLVIIGHSVGGFLSAMATEDLEVGQKTATPSGGGVEKFIFFAAGILPVGAQHPPMRMMNIKDGAAYCREPDELLFHDVDPAVAAKYQPFFDCQPAEGWMGECTYTGWDKVPSGYILTEHDRVISPEIQAMCSDIAKSKVLRIPTGHLPILSQPTLLAEKIGELISQL